PRAAIEPDFGCRSGACSLLSLGERAINGLLAHPMRAVRIREVAGDEDQIGLELVEKRADDADVGRSDGILANLSRSIERQVEKARIAHGESKDLDAAHGCGLADVALDVLYVRRVHVAGLLVGEEIADALHEVRGVVPRLVAIACEPRQKIEIAAHVVVEHDVRRYLDFLAQLARDGYE